MELGAAIKAARKKAGLSQDELASRVGCGRPQISRIETGAKGVSFALFSLLCRELSLDANAIVNPPVLDGSPGELIAPATESAA